MNHFTRLYTHKLDNDLCHIVEFIYNPLRCVFIPTISLFKHPYVTRNIYEISIIFLCFELRITLNEHIYPF